MKENNNLALLPVKGLRQLCQCGSNAIYLLVQAQQEATR